MGNDPFTRNSATLQRRKKTKSAKAVKELYPSPVKHIAIRAAKHKRVLEMLREDTKVIRLAKAGHTFEEIAAIVTDEKEAVGEPGISPGEALILTRQAIDKWCGELALDARQARELDLKRLDALMVILWAEIEPKPLVDQWGFPVLDGVTGEPAMSKPDYIAVKLYQETLARRAKMLGLDAQESAVQVNVEQNTLVRQYVGADPSEL